VRERDGDREVGEDPRQDRHVVALPGEGRQVSLVGPLEELHRPLTEERLGGGDPAPGQLLQHPVRVEQHMPDDGAPAQLVGHSDDELPAPPRTSTEPHSRSWASTNSSTRSSSPMPSWCRVTLSRRGGGVRGLCARPRAASVRTGLVGFGGFLGLPRLPQVPRTWNSDIWAPFWTLLAVKLSWTYWSVVPEGRLIVTVLPVEGFQV